MFHNVAYIHCEFGIKQKNELKLFVTVVKHNHSLLNNLMFGTYETVKLLKLDSNRNVIAFTF